VAIGATPVVRAIMVAVRLEEELALLLSSLMELSLEDVKILDVSQVCGCRYYSDRGGRGGVAYRWWWRRSYRCILWVKASCLV